MLDISTSYLGIPLKNPVIIGSSGLTGSVEKIVALEKVGAAGVVLKSLFEEEIIREMENSMKSMASDVFLYPEAVEFYENNFQKEESTDQYLQLISDAKEKVKIPVIASINCISTGPWTYFPKRLEEAGADGIELNMFILPSDPFRTAEENEGIYFNIVEEVIKQVSIPVSIKISFYSSGLANFIKRLSRTGIKGVVLFNRFYNPDFDIDTFEITSSRVLSEPGDISISLRWIALLYEKVACDLIASTGVHDASGLVKQLLAGANAVQVVSSLYKNGIEHTGMLLAGLEKWMEEKEYTTLADFKGKMSQKKVASPAAYERVQFMKYFKGYNPG